MIKKKSRKTLRGARHLRIRQKVSGTSTVPRMTVCVTTHHLHVQVIDDDAGRTLAAGSTTEAELRNDKVKANVAGATILGKRVAERAIAAGIKQVVFDRGGCKFHGKVKAIADSAREAGLQF
jgi:large subunit ribosomal protein L18